MTQLSKGDTFSNGEQVTAARLNQLVDSATLNAGAITAQPNMAPNTLAADDSLLAYDLSDNTLREIKASDIINSGLPLTTGSITGNAGSDIVVTPAATRKLLVSGNSDVTGNTNVGGSLTVSANSVFNGTGALKIPVGTTAERPSSPLSGQIRFNSTTTDAEVYNGSAWESFNPVESSALTANGFVKLSNGLILQWGTSAVGMANYGAQTINFPTAFATACFSVQITAKTATVMSNGAAGYENGIKLNGNPTTTSFSVYCNWAGNLAGGVVYPTWFAVGI